MTVLCKIAISVPTIQGMGEEVQQPGHQRRGLVEGRRRIEGVCVCVVCFNAVVLLLDKSTERLLNEILGMSVRGSAQFQKEGCSRVT